MKNGFKKSLAVVATSVAVALTATSSAHSNETSFIAKTERLAECTYFLNGEEKTFELPANVYVKIKEGEINSSKNDSNRVQIKTIIPIESYGENEPHYEYVDGTVSLSDLKIAEIPKDIYDDLDMMYFVNFDLFPKSTIISIRKNAKLNYDKDDANLYALKNGTYVLGSRELKEDPRNYIDLDNGYLESFRFVMLGYFNEASGTFEIGYVRENNANPIGLFEENKDLWSKNYVNALLDLSNEDNIEQYIYPYQRITGVNDIIIPNGTGLCLTELPSNNGNVLVRAKFENEKQQIDTFYLSQKGLKTMVTPLTPETEELIEKAINAGPLSWGKER